MFIKNTTINANISIIFRLNKGYIIKLKKQSTCKICTLPF
jgi:hypothetical protein